MIGFGGAFGHLEHSEAHVARLESLHACPGLNFGGGRYADRRLAAVCLARQELLKDIGEDLVWEDDTHLVMLEGVLASRGADNACKRILDGWLERGEDFLSGLNGEFVLLIYDKAGRELVLATDRFGSRSLFYAQQGPTLFFGSEIKSVLSGLGAAPAYSKLGVLEFFFFSHNLGERTLFEGVKALPPASVLRCRNGAVRLGCYWRMRFSTRGRQSNAAVQAEAVEVLRKSARVKLGGRQRLGLGLSGGLDSRLIAALIPDDARPVLARTYGQPESLEVRAAVELARRLGFEHLVQEPKDVEFSTILYPSVWRTEGRTHFTGLKSIIEHKLLGEKTLYNLPGHFVDVLTGKQLRPFMFIPRSRGNFVETVLYHYTGYTFKNETVLRSIFNPQFYDACIGPLKDAFRDSFSSIEADHNWDLYDAWDLTNRQPRFTFASGAVDNYVLMKMCLFTDYDFVDLMLQVPGSLRFGQSLYKAMIARGFPEVADIPNANTGRLLKRGCLANMADLRHQYLQSQRNRRIDSQGRTGKAALIRKDNRFRKILDDFAQDESFPAHLLSREGLMQAVADHYDRNVNNSYLLGVLGTFAAVHELFGKSAVQSMPDIARPW